MRSPTVALLSLLCLFLSITSLAVAASASSVRTASASCPSSPPCRNFALSSWGFIWNRIMHPMKCSRQSYDFSDPNHQREISQRLNELLSHVVGQEHVIKPVKQRLIAKISNPSKPLVFLFTGDNGVGKTMTANLISLAMSLRCGGTVTSECAIGDAALSITASESNFESRAALAKRIADHAYAYPKGVVILNEVLMLNPEVFDALGPLMGRGSTFYDHPHAPLNGLTVILTSDFGKHVGVTQSKTADEIAQYTRTAFSKRFGLRYASEMSAHAFLPLSYENAVEACKRFIINLPCRKAQVSHVSVSDDAVDKIVENLVNSGLTADNNAREITNHVTQQVDGVVAGILYEKFPGGVADVRVSIRLDSQHNQIVVGVSSDSLRIFESEYADL